MGNSPKKSVTPETIENGLTKTSDGSLRDTFSKLTTIATVKSCPVCCSECDCALEFSKCHHSACRACWLTFLCTQLSAFRMSGLTCIECREALTEQIVIDLLSQAIVQQQQQQQQPPPDGQQQIPDNVQMLYHRYEEFILRRALSRETHMRWCPRGCGYGLIGIGFEACPRMVCPSVECESRSFCFRCSRPWTSDDASEADPLANHVCQLGDNPERNETVEGILTFFGLDRARRRTSIITPHAQSSWRPNRQNIFVFDEIEGASDMGGSPLSDNINIQHRRSLINGSSTEEPSKHLRAGVSPSPTRITLLKSPTSESGEGKSEVKPCPKCGTLIQKLDDGSCNHMQCSLCSFDFCWLCLRENTADHYLSLSGCTVWGRDVWSPRRRFTVLFLLLFLTPIVLPLLIAIGFPAIGIALSSGCVGLPERCTNMGARLRVVFAVIFFVLSLPLSFIASALIIVCAVPLIIFYIYFYLPYRAIKLQFCSSRPTLAPPIDIADIEHLPSTSAIPREGTETEVRPSVIQPPSPESLRAKPTVIALVNEVAVNQADD